MEFCSRISKKNIIHFYDMDFEIGKPQGIQVSKKFEDISLDLKKD